MSMTAVATAPDTHQYLTVAEAAAFYRVHEDTLRAWIRKGLLPYTRVGPYGIIRLQRCHLEQAVTPADQIE